MYLVSPASPIEFLRWLKNPVVDNQLGKLIQLSDPIVDKDLVVRPAKLVHKSFLKWLNDPVVNKDLGRRIVNDLQRMGRVRRYF